MKRTRFNHKHQSTQSDDTDQISPETELSPRRGPGRPRKQIDGEQVRALAAIGCTYREIAAVLGCAKNLLERNFSDVIKDAHQYMTMSVKRMQYRSAQKGSVTMQIWLGKQYLGQKDRPLLDQPFPHDDFEGLENTEQPSIDLSALDDDMLEQLMGAISQETISRESYYQQHGSGLRRTH